MKWIASGLQKVSVVGIGLAILGTPGCKQALQISKTAYVIGNNDIVRLDSNALIGGTVQVADSSVLISTLVAQKKRKFCSGTLIKSSDGENLRVLTNHHCFANVDSNGNVATELLAEACTSTQVFLGFRAGETDQSTVVSCLPGSLKTDPPGDLAVFTLASKVPERFRPLEIWSRGEVPAGRPAMIVHYPDVDENFMQVTGTRSKLPVASLTDNDCQTQGSFPESEWRFDATLPFSMKHSCDLLHGSSGSALIDQESRTILGVNWGGIKIDYKKRVDTINVATRADYVLAFLSGDTSQWQTNLAAAQNVASGNASKSAERSSSASGITCGVIGLASGAGAFGLLPMVFFAAPIATLFIRRRKS
jgi:hypothetical protein